MKKLLAALPPKITGYTVQVKTNPKTGVVTVTEDPDGGGQIWTRLYARASGFPQVIHRGHDLIQSPEKFQKVHRL